MMQKTMDYYEDRTLENRKIKKFKYIPFSFHWLDAKWLYYDKHRNPDHKTEETFEGPNSIIKIKFILPRNIVS